MLWEGSCDIQEVTHDIWEELSMSRERSRTTYGKS